MKQKEVVEIAATIMAGAVANPAHAYLTSNEWEFTSTFERIINNVGRALVNSGVEIESNIGG